MPMKARLELRAVVGLDDETRNGRRRQHLVDEADRRALVAGIVDLEHADARAVIDRRELVEPLPRAGDPLEELHIHLQPMARLRLLVPLPALRVRAMLLVAWQAVHPMPHQNAMHRRHRQRLLVKALQIVRDLARPEMVGLAQVQNLANDLARRGVGRPVRACSADRTGPPAPWASNRRFHR